MKVRFVSFACLMMALATFSIGSQALSPLSYSEIVDRVDASPVFACSAVRQRKVDFELTAEKRAELTALKAAPEFVACVGESPAPSKLTIQCGPVPCEVFSGTQSLGQTTNGTLSREVPWSNQPLRVEARASGYRAKSADVRLEINKDSAQSFVLEPLPGTLELTCSAGGSECEIALNDAAPQRTQQGRLQIGNLAAAEYRIKASAPGFLPAERRLTIRPGAADSLALAMDRDPKFVYESMLKALGGKENLVKARTAQAEGTATTHLSKGEQSLDAYFVESISLPSGIRWDLQIPDSKNKNQPCITVGSIKNVPLSKVWESVGKCGNDSPFLPDLRRSVDAFKMLRVSDLIPELQDEKKYQKKIVQIEGTPHLVAESSDDTFTIRYDAAFLPRRIIHEPKARVVKTEVSLGRYSNVGGVMLPCEMSVLFPADRPNFAHEIVFSNYYLNPWLEPAQDFPNPSEIKDKNKQFISKPYKYDETKPGFTTQIFPCAK